MALVPMRKEGRKERVERRKERRKSPSIKDHRKFIVHDSISRRSSQLGEPCQQKFL